MFPFLAKGQIPFVVVQWGVFVFVSFISEIKLFLRMNCLGGTDVNRRKTPSTINSLRQRKESKKKILNRQIQHNRFFFLHYRLHVTKRNKKTKMDFKMFKTNRKKQRQKKWVVVALVKVSEAGAASTHHQSAPNGGGRGLADGLTSQTMYW